MAHGIKNFGQRLDSCIALGVQRGRNIMAEGHHSITVEERGLPHDSQVGGRKGERGREGERMREREELPLDLQERGRFVCSQF